MFIGGRAGGAAPLGCAAAVLPDVAAPAIAAPPTAAPASVATLRASFLTFVAIRVLSINRCWMLRVH